MDIEASEFDALLARLREILEQQAKELAQTHGTSEGQVVAEGLDKMTADDLLDALRILKNHGDVRANIYWYHPAAEPNPSEGWNIDISEP